MEFCGNDCKFDISLGDILVEGNHFSENWEAGVPIDLIKRTLQSFPRNDHILKLGFIKSMYSYDENSDHMLVFLPSISSNC